MDRHGLLSRLAIAPLLLLLLLTGGIATRAVEPLKAVREGGRCALTTSDAVEWKEVGARSAASVTNGGFENGSFSGWTAGGDTPGLQPRIVTSYRRSGTYAAVIGQENAPCAAGEGGLVGQSWIYQDIDVPNFAQPQLMVHHRIFTYDKLNGGKYDRLEIYINGTLLIRLGNTGLNSYGCGDPVNDLGWRTFAYDLSAYRGQTIRLRLVNVTHPDDWYGTWTYVDDVEIVGGGPRVYLPLLLRRWPPIPETPMLYAISAPGEDRSYTVSWNSAEHATSYVLQGAAKATTPADGDFTTVYSGWNRSYSVSDQGTGRYYYRVKGRNSWGDGAWSNVEWVDVLWEEEPNGRDEDVRQANGPLVSGKTYRGYPNDADDYFYIELSSPATVNVLVEDFVPTGSSGTVVLYGPAVGGQRGEQIEYYPGPGDTMALGPHALGPGKYYVRVYTAGSHSTTQAYRLTVTY